MNAAVAFSMLSDLPRDIATDTASGGETTLSVPGIDTLVAALPFTARHLIVRWSALASAGTPSISLRFNNDSGALYNSQDAKGVGSAKSALSTDDATSLPVGTLSSTAFEFSGGEILIPAAFLTATYKSFTGLYGEVENNISVMGGWYAATPAITRVDLIISSGSFVAASLLTVAVVDEMFAVPGAETIIV